MSQRKYIQYKLISEALKYPTASLKSDVIKCDEYLKKLYPETYDDFKLFSDWVKATPLDEMEEVYTKTFHIQAICYLDLGYVLFGEDYKRGEFLVNMKSEQQLANNDCGTELPDNLINVLSLIPKIKDTSFRNELAVRVIIPSLEKMLDEFKSARMELKTKILRKKHKAILQENQKNGNIYQYALKSLSGVVKNDFRGIQFEQPENVNAVTTLGFEAAACGSCSFIDNKTIKSVRR